MQMKNVGNRLLAARVCVMLAMNSMTPWAMAAPGLIDYIESDGTQYIDTGITGKSGTTVELDFMLMDAANGTDYIVLGSRKADGTDTRFYPVYFYGTKASYSYQTWRSSSPEFFVNLSTRLQVTTTFDAGLQTMDFESRRVLTTTDAPALDTERPMYLFAGNCAGTAKYFCKVRCYGLKIWQNGELVRNFKPCLTSANVGALYDTVSNTYFNRAAGNQFEIPVLNRVETGSPDRYVEYIESDGTQVLDTGIRAKTGVKAECVMQWSELTSDAESTFLGATGGSTLRMYMVHKLQDGRLWSGYGSAGSGLQDKRWTSAKNVSAVTSRPMRFVVDYGPQATVSVDGVQCFSATAASSVDSGRNLTVFAVRNTTGVGCRAKARCYKLKIWVNGDLERDFVPCVKDGKGALYDRVRGEIVFPVGDITGNLIGGPADPDGGKVAFVDYVESDGKQYVDTGVAGQGGVKADIDILFTELGTTDQGILGSKKDANTTWFMPFSAYANRLFYGWYEWKDVQLENKLTANRRYRIIGEMKKGRQFVSLDDQTVVDTDDPTGRPSLDTAANMYLFGINDVGKGYARFPIKARCYGLKIWQDEVLVRDFKPCCVDGEGALYDAVSDGVFKGQPFDGSKQPQLLTPKASGRFERKVTGTPDYFVEYLEADGKQILDTGIGDGSGLKVETELMVTACPGEGEENTYLGSLDGRRMLMIHYLPTSGDSKLWAGYGSTAGYATDASGRDQVLQTGAKHKVVVDFSDKGNLTVCKDDSVGFRKSSSDDYADNVTLTLFAANRGGYAQFFSKARCYYLKIWKGGKLVRSFRPCVKGGTAGLYDSVENEVVFPVVPAVADVGETYDPFAGGENFRPKYYLDYVESDGSIFFDTGVIGRSGTKAELDVTGTWQDETEGTLAAQDITVLGARKSIYGLDPQRFFLFNVTKGKAGLGYGAFFYATQDGKTTEVKAQERMTVTTELNVGSQTMDINGVRVHTASGASTVDSGLPLYLFSENFAGESKGRGKVRCHRLKLWQDGLLVRDYRPVMTKEGVAALWDEVNEKLCYPSAPFASYGDITGKFAVGFMLFLR